MAPKQISSSAAKAHDFIDFLNTSPTQTELFPIAGLIAAELNRTGATEKKDDKEDESEKPFKPLQELSDRHHPYVVELIAQEAGVEVEDVVDFEIILYDTQDACIGGINNELIFGGRLDNLGMTYCAVEGLIGSVSDPSALDDESSIRLITCFDHEEIGSTSAQAYEQSLATSFLMSADMAHSVNPNYLGKYESDHRPEMNKGTVIKINANQRYATNSPGIVLVEE
ncbi:putative Aspartyl aminopeptidase [Glarea lozoyensis 74030]|uniref:aspartyl aminopeptidase n=1 Tax=Glarea lozoyensis (strain ATCC 74030 / MF5533) TaxID=1104152 RepID=H0EHX8_GLAL7|nr:putative Aspartyl aminopeptidase [Glarea lozoyensis 74030]